MLIVSGLDLPAANYIQSECRTSRPKTWLVAPSAALRDVPRQSTGLSALDVLIILVPAPKLGPAPQIGTFLRSELALVVKRHYKAVPLQRLQQGFPAMPQRCHRCEKCALDCCLRKLTYGQPAHE